MYLKIRCDYGPHWHRVGIWEVFCALEACKVECEKVWPGPKVSKQLHESLWPVWMKN